MLLTPNYRGLTGILEHARGSLDRARGIFRHYSTVLEVCFGRARGIFQICARLKPCLNDFFSVVTRSLTTK